MSPNIRHALHELRASAREVRRWWARRHQRRAEFREYREALDRAAEGKDQDDV